MWTLLWYLFLIGIVLNVLSTFMGCSNNNGESESAEYGSKESDEYIIRRFTADKLLREEAERLERERSVKPVLKSYESTPHHEKEL